MSDQLSFDVALTRSGFTLRMADALPLTGITAITGPSGSGKTTLLRILAGLEPGADGQVTLGPRTMQGQGVWVPPHQRGIGYVFQEPRLFPHMNVAGNIGYGAKRRGVEQGRIDEIVQVLDLGALMGRDIRGLSGGESRRVALGRVLASGPDILFLDEPLTGLDQARKSEILPHIARASQAFKLPALFVSHATDEVLTLADRILTLSDGQIKGWAPSPARLAAQVMGRSGTKAKLAIGPHRLALSLDTRMGERWSLSLDPDGVLLSDAEPGAHSALIALPARIANVDAARLTLDVAGQTLTWPKPLALSQVGTGDTVWLSVLRVFARPERSDQPMK